MLSPRRRAPRGSNALRASLWRSTLPTGTAPINWVCTLIEANAATRLQVYNACGGPKAPTILATHRWPTMGGAQTSASTRQKQDRKHGCAAGSSPVNARPGAHCSQTASRLGQVKTLVRGQVKRLDLLLPPPLFPLLLLLLLLLLLMPQVVLQLPRRPLLRRRCIIRPPRS